MKTKVCFHLSESVHNWVPAPGYEFYLVQKYWTNTGESRLDGHEKMLRTNVSREPRAHGWLGTTDNIHREGLGKYRVIKVLGNCPKYWNEGVEVELEKIDL